jgi:hypothetical protein
MMMVARRRCLPFCRRREFLFFFLPQRGLPTSDVTSSAQSPAAVVGKIRVLRQPILIDNR